MPSDLTASTRPLQKLQSLGSEFFQKQTSMLSSGLREATPPEALWEAKGNRAKERHAKEALIVEAPPCKGISYLFCTIKYTMIYTTRYHEML